MNTLHFNDKEFSCSCCGVSIVDSELIAVLELVRCKFGAVKVTSGYRCNAHNKAIGGKEKSKHLLGIAADIQVKGVKPGVIFDFLGSVFPNYYGIGNYKTFTHIDVRSKKARW